MNKLPLPEALSVPASPSPSLAYVCSHVGSRAHTFQLAFWVHLYPGGPQPGNLRPKAGDGRS